MIDSFHVHFAEWADVRSGGEMLRLLGLTALLMGVAGFVFAGIQTAPEIDASTGVAALTLLSGGLIVLRARRRKQ
jgi:hypothetical protein